MAGDRARRAANGSPTGSSNRPVAVAIDGRLEPRHVDLRAFVLAAGDDVLAVPAGLTRVALDRGELVVNSSKRGGGKDTWVMS